MNAHEKQIPWQIMWLYWPRWIAE